MKEFFKFNQLILRKLVFAFLFFLSLALFAEISRPKQRKHVVSTHDDYLVASTDQPPVPNDSSNVRSQTFHCLMRAPHPQPSARASPEPKQNKEKISIARDISKDKENSVLILDYNHHLSTNCPTRFHLVRI